MMRGLQFAIFLFAISFTYAVNAADYVHNFTATGYNADRSLTTTLSDITAISSVSVRTGPRRSGSGTRCHGNRGFMYQVVGENLSTGNFTDEIRACIVGPTGNTWSDCTESALPILSKARTSNDYEIISADMAISNYAVAVGWGRTFWNSNCYCNIQDKVFY